MPHLQGPVPLGDPTYIDRPFEKLIIRDLLSGKWVLLLGPRQHGKTSALIRIRASLLEAGLHTAIVDLQAAPPLSSYKAFIIWFASVIAEQIETSVSEDRAETQDIGSLLAAVLPPGKLPVVVLIDEASNIPDAAWRNSFYGQLRAISSRRALGQSDGAAARLRFAFAGTFRPETLIDQANSPFNVCERYDSEDFSSENILTLSRMFVAGQAETIAQTIEEEVGGQPFLVQKLLGRLDGVEHPITRLALEIDDLQSGQSDHVGHLFTKVLSEAKLALLATSMVAQGSVRLEPADPDFRYLQILGIARRESRALVFRNNLYKVVASSSPQLGGAAEPQRSVPLFSLPVGAFAKVQNAELREIAWSSHTGAVAAYNSGAFRVALAALGGSLEALLLDLMLRQPASALATAVTQAKCAFHGGENARNPNSWSLNNLIKVAGHVGGARHVEPPQAMREWRNTIHPAVAMRNYRLDADYEPEARVAAALHEIALRDLP